MSHDELVSLKSQLTHKKPKYSSPIDGRRSRTPDEDIDEMDDDDDDDDVMSNGKRETILFSNEYINIIHAISFYFNGTRNRN